MDEASKGKTSRGGPKLLMAEDLRVDNDIHVGQSTLSCQLSAVALEFRFVPVDEAHAEGLARIDAMMRWALPGFEAWLLLGDFGWRPNRPLYRYTTLWYRGKKYALIPEGERLAERMIESLKGIKFFAATRPGAVDPASIDKLLSRSGRSYAFAYMRCSHAREIVEGFIAAGWEPLNSPGLFCPEFSAPVCGGNMLIYCPLGAYDDADAGAALIGHPELIRKCHVALSGSGNQTAPRLTH
jgi:hypothetical protein